MISFNHRYVYHITLIALVLYLFLASLVSGSYVGPSKGLGYIKPRYAPATFLHDMKLYSYGGQNRTDTSNIFTAISLSTKNDSKGEIVYENIPQSKLGPISSFSQSVVLPDGHTVLMFMGLDYNTFAFNDIIHTYTYNLEDSNGSWVETFAVNNLTGPNVRRDFTATLAPNGKVYIYGGSDTIDTVFQDFWSFDPNTWQYTNISRPITPRFGHTATALPNGQIVYIDGAFLIEDSKYGVMNTIVIYDTITDTWTQKTTEGQRVATLWGSSAALGPDNKTIFVFGGNGINNTFHNSIFLLDTTTWIWTTPYISGNYPTARTYFSMGFINTNILAILYGGGPHIGYSDTNILRIDDQGNFSWLSGPDDYLNLDSSENIQSGKSGGEIAGIIAGVLILTTILGFCAWKTFNDASYIPNLMRNFAWDQRGGEPIWTEISRLILKLILIFLFLAYLVFSIRQALESPTTSITIRTKILSVRVPDVRFCVEGLEMPAYPTEITMSEFRNRISCITDKGFECSSFITWLDMSTHFPKFEDSNGYSDCYLFSSPSWFRLGTSSDGYSNGTKLQFEFIGDIQSTVTTRITQYPPGMDPNVKVYKTNTSDVPSLMSDEAIKEWSMRDIQGINDPNTLTVYTNEALSIQYQIKDHQYLEEIGWNRIGFLSRYSHTPELSYSSTRSNSSIMNERFLSYTYIFGAVTIYPIGYFDIIEQDQKIHTIINSLGSVGGIISIVIVIQVLLFGFRPRSPWGIIQRWAYGSMRKSLVRNLQRKFGGHNTRTPFINPVYSQSEDTGRKYDDQINETEDSLLERSSEEELKYLRSRMSRMERRVQLTESLLEAYYIDVEIFRELDRNTSYPNKDLSGTISEESDLSYSSTI